MNNTLLPCPFCGKQIAEIGNCKNMEECEHFEECPAVEPYVCVVCSINKGGCGASTGYHEGVEKAIAAWNRRAGKDINVATNSAVPVVRGKWVDDENGTEWDSHQCSVCKKSSLSEMIYEDDYDEGLDGEWFYLGKRENGIIEHLTKYCPNCGAKMEDKP